MSSPRRRRTRMTPGDCAAILTGIGVVLGAIASVIQSLRGW